MAHPDLIDERKDMYEIDMFRRTFESWLLEHPDIESFTLQPVTELSDLFPRVSDGEVEQATDIADLRGVFLKTISK